MSYPELIGRPADAIPHASITPRYAPGPPGETPGTRTRVHPRRVAHAAALQRHAWLGAAVGGEQARWDGYQ